jgi:hypothetical protein
VTIFFIPLQSVTLSIIRENGIFAVAFENTVWKKVPLIILYMTREICLQLVMNLSLKVLEMDVLVSYIVMNYAKRFIFQVMPSSYCAGEVKLCFHHRGRDHAETNEYIGFVFLPMKSWPGHDTSLRSRYTGDEFRERI